MRLMKKMKKIMRYPEDPLYPDPSLLKSSSKNFKALDDQVGGEHYKKMAIQPIEYIVKNGIGYCEGNIIKYVTRHHQKGGPEDIKKVIHYCNLLLELHYPKNKKPYC